jgi:hypothetical protein
MKFSKKKLISLFLISSVVMMSMSSSEDSPDGKAGHNGSPGEQTCAKSTCHTSYTLNSGPGSVSITAPGMTNWQYVPGQTYTINVTVAQNSMPLFGFGFEALLSSGANAGTLTAGTGSHALNATVSGNSRKTITHLEDSGLVTGTKTWSFTWVAPANGAAVTFYAAGNAANNSSSDSGDYIYTTSQAVTAVVVPNAPTISNAGQTLLCNGATATLSIPTQSGVTFTWFDESDIQVGTGTSFVASETGCYHVVASGSGGTANSTNTICITASSISAEFDGLSTEYCEDDDVVSLVPEVEGGSFTGNGVSGNSFIPANAGPGTHNVTYTVTNGDGCTSTVIKSVVVHEVLSANFTLSENTVCVGNNVVELLPEVEGGTFSGPGVLNQQFVADLDPGIYQITYVNGTGSCAQTFALDVEVLPAPDASFFGLPVEICSNAPAFPLEPLMPGGAFSGSGMSTVIFDPALALPGENIITYQLLGGNGCSSTSSQSVLVNQYLSPEFTVSSQEVCDNDEFVLLTATSDGGSFSGVGVDSNGFNPSVGAGEYIITHSIGQGSCATSETNTILVNVSPDAGFVGLENGYCTNAEVVELTPITSGGVFSGVGVSGNSFDPSVPTPGQVGVTYSLTAENGCSSSVTTDVVILASANSSFSGLPENICIDEIPVQLITESAGGNFIGDGMTGSSFDPSIAGVGTHEITYAIDLVGCSSSTIDTIIVNGLPELSVSGLNANYCEDEPIAVLSTNQIGAILSGDGITDNMFDPSSAGIGAHNITCTFTDEFGCSSTWVAETNVIPLPSAVVTLNGTTLTADQQNASYAWFDCDTNQPVNNATAQSFTPISNANYAVEISLDGCVATSDCIEVIVISVNEANIPELMVYPNPAVDHVHVKYPVPSEVFFYAMDGRLVHSTKTNAGLHRLDISTLNPGVYDMVIINSSGSFDQKLYIHNGE